MPPREYVFVCRRCAPGTEAPTCRRTSMPVSRRRQAARVRSAGVVPPDGRGIARARDRAPATDQSASGEGAEVGPGSSRDAPGPLETVPNGHAATTDFQAVGVLELARLPPSAAARYRDGRRHDASGDVSTRARTGALERRVRPAVPPSCRRPLRRESRTGCSSTTSSRSILKPAPDEVQQLYLQSLEACGIDLRAHDVRFEEDNWESPTLGAWGIGWQVLFDGQEITQFTYFQQAGRHRSRAGLGRADLRARTSRDGAAGRGQRVRSSSGRRA